MSKVKNINRKRLLEILKKSSLALLTATMVLATGCNNEEQLADEDFVESKNQAIEYIEELNEDNRSAFFSYLNVTTTDLLNLPSNIENLTFFNCHYVDSLDIIPNICPNIRSLEIDCCSSIVNLDFIYKLNNLEKLTIASNASVSHELVEYLNSKGIEHNITEEDIKIAEKIDEILNDIISEDMSYREKIKAISLYVSENYSYDLDYIEESNDEPLKCMLNNKKGVCAGYAYLTETLLSKAGITSFQITSATHTWNIVEEDDKYYYLDITNLHLKPLIKYFDFGINYMVSPTENASDAIFSYDSGTNKVIIPKQLVEEIEKSEGTKSFNEKYGSGTTGIVLKLVLPAITIISVISGGTKLTSVLLDKLKRSKYRKEQRRKLKQQKKKEKRQLKITQVKKKKTKKLNKQENISIIREPILSLGQDTIITEKEQDISTTNTDINNHNDVPSSIKPKKEIVVTKKKELTPYELMLNELKSDFEKYSDFRSVLYRDYNIYLINNPYIPFVDYLKKNKRYNTVLLISYENKKINVINLVYEEYSRLYPDFLLDTQMFLFYCKTRSKLIKDLGGIDNIISSSDIEMFIENIIYNQKNQKNNINI